MTHWALSMDSRNVSVYHDSVYGSLMLKIGCNAAMRTLSPAVAGYIWSR